MPVRRKITLLLLCLTAMLTAVSYVAVLTDRVTRTATIQVAGDSLPCLAFTSPNEFTIATGNSTKNWDGSLYYSTDKFTWTEWDGADTLFSSDGELYMRGMGNTVISGGYGGKGWMMTGTDVSCDGNIETLLDCATVKAGEHPTMAPCAFSFLFADYSALIAPPRLEATTLNWACYYGMFDGVESLLTAPELPVTALAPFCYCEMFRGCTALAIAPELPATVLPQNCYNSMFYGCTSLAAAPEIPAATVGEHCCEGMFMRCTSLVTPPSTLPATTLADSCYKNMFRECPALTSAPALPAATLAKDCCNLMFYRCSSLVFAPELPATTLAENCYKDMFHECISLTTAPSTLPAITLEPNCYHGMFCSSGITVSPALPATTLAPYCYAHMLRDCPNLTAIPELIATGELPEGCYSHMFYESSSVKVSLTQHNSYQQPYRIPSSGTATIAAAPSSDSSYQTRAMFCNTGGEYDAHWPEGYADINTSYYLDTSNSIVPAT